MCTPADEHIDVHLPGQCREHVCISCWHYLLAVNDAYSDGLVGDREGEGEMCILTIPDQPSTAMADLRHEPV